MIISSGRKTERCTRQRRVILEELQRTDAHPTAVELYDIVRRRLPRISLGTVYRNLELLSRKGTIQKLSLGSSEARFDGSLTPHHHVRCAGCGRVDDVYGLSVDFGPMSWESSLATKYWTTIWNSWGIAPIVAVTDLVRNRGED